MNPTHIKNSNQEKVYARPSTVGGMRVEFDSGEVTYYPTERFRELYTIIEDTEQ